MRHNTIKATLTFRDQGKCWGVLMNMTRVLFWAPPKSKLTAASGCKHSRHLQRHAASDAKGAGALKSPCVVASYRRRALFATGAIKLFLSCSWSLSFPTLVVVGAAAIAVAPFLLA